MHVQARFDGQDYEVAGSPIADKIAYTRINSHCISGIGRKSGSVSVYETVSVSADGNTLTQDFSLHMAGRVIASGIAVFERET